MRTANPHEVDNGYTVYVNEQEIGSSEDWTTTDSYTFVAPCESPTVYGIESHDLGGVAAVIADISHCGEVLDLNGVKMQTVR